MFPLLYIAPLLVSILLVALLRRESQLVKAAALIGSLTPLLFIAMLMGQVGSVFSMNWFDVAGSHFAITANVMPINFLLYLLVAIIAPLVVLYSAGFMNVLSDNKRFYVELLSFEAAMLAFSLAGNFLLLFIAWEFLSVTSYLLIGFWNYKESAISAARKTITIILLGDIALLAAIAIFFVNFGTLDFNAIIAQASTTGINAGVLAALTLVLIAIFTKSAQFPFQEWLSAAMEGPTPVSAFLHSSTMVKAGVFLLLVLYPMYSGTKLMPIIEIVGAITALIGIGNAIVGTHVKKVLAYSTVEELGLMLFAIGIGAYAAAIYFFFAQTFYKALLFFYAGSLMRANQSEDIREMRDSSRSRILFISALFGVLALAGFAPFNGFFANMGLEGSATNIYTYGFLLFVDIAVSLFIARWFFIPLRSATNRAIGGKIAMNYDLLPIAMKIPIVILALLCIVTSYFVGYIYFGIASPMAKFGYPQIAQGASNFAIGNAAIETALVLAGVALIYLLYRKGYKENVRFGLAKRILGSGAFFNELYSYAANFAFYAAGAFEFVDSELNGFFDYLGRDATAFGSVVRNIETGSVTLYAFVTIVGLALLIAFVVIR
ncbi:MAG: NADH-quinone oxidoreductase subunit L [Candidatus Micrarchaeota archaeon]|nr:NADH-quinone oxidoreductase subunit L [Candidatus Micrarchaeota archaeon]